MKDLVNIQDEITKQNRNLTKSQAQELKMLDEKADSPKFNLKINKLSKDFPYIDNSPPLPDQPIKKGSKFKVNRNSE